MPDKDIYWNLFEHSGSIDAYLAYTKLKDKNKETGRSDFKDEPL